ncbi:MAG: EcsC family protein [Opitutaceae bacterium]
MNPEDLDDLKVARDKLENTSLAAKVTNLIGAPLEKGFEILPDKIRNNLGSITQAALKASMRSALFTLKDAPNTENSNKLHKLAAAASGGIGGALGLAALSVELPLSTTIMLRSIADIARSEGESINNVESRLSCLEVFAFGSPQNKADDAVETGYFAVRASLAQSVSAAAHHLASKGLAAESSPAIVRMINLIAQRFSIQVSEKLAAQAIPAIGAAGGALINTVFIDHFQQMAHGHFTIRRLERKYGKEIIWDAYHEQ